MSTVYRDDPDLPRTSLTVPVVVSLVLHLLGLLAVGRGWVPLAVPVPPPEPASNPLRFELVETPESAAVEEARDAELVSNRDTRSQQPVPDPERAVTRTPDVPREGEGRDLRPTGTAPQLGMPQPPRAPAAQPSRPSRPSPSRPEDRPTPEAETDTPEGLRVEPRPQRAPPPRQEPEQRDAEPTERQEPSRPRPESPPSPRVPAADEPVPPTAFQIDEESRRGQPSLSQAEKEMLARAEAAGEYSFEATQHLFADYFLRLRDQIENTWLLLLTSRYTGLDRSRAVVDFLIQPDGTVTALTPQASEGDELFPLVSTLAVRNAAPFDPVPYDAIPDLPPGARDLPLRVRVTFNYR